LSKYEKKAIGRKFILSPLPVAVFTPLLVDLMNKEKLSHDFDINIDVDASGVSFCLLEYGSSCWTHRCHLEKEFVETAKSKVAPWRVDAISSEGIVNMILKYVGHV